MIASRTPLHTSDVADHYDELDRFYRELWGEHVHHGLWRTGEEPPTVAAEQLVAHVADRLALLAAAGFEVAMVEDLSARVKATWPRCARALGRRLLTDASYRRFIASSASRNRVFALTMLRIWAAYEIGAMRYLLFVARRGQPMRSPY
jgi:hypothetical protein